MLGIAPGGMQPGDFGGIRLQTAKGVEQPSVLAGIDQRPLIVLAVDFNQRRADGPQQTDAHRLIVDKGTGLAVDALHPAQNYRTVRCNTVFSEQRPGRMIGLRCEFGDHLAAFGVGPHQRVVAPATQRQRQGIEQNGLAGTRLTGQHRQPSIEFDAEPINKNDILNSEIRQHDWPLSGRATLAEGP